MMDLAFLEYLVEHLLEKILAAPDFSLVLRGLWRSIHVRFSQCRGSRDISFSWLLIF